jgi:predicted acyl esterase
MPQTTQVLALVTLAVLTGSAHAQEARMVPVTVDGERVRLEMRVYEPAAGAPSPTLVFNHGSTGSGTNPESFTRPLDFPEVARFFVARGWAVVIPGRRGRGGSEGRYDEGFAPTRSWAMHAIRCCRSRERTEPCAISRPRWIRSSRCRS